MTDRQTTEAMTIDRQTDSTAAQISLMMARRGSAAAAVAAPVRAAACPALRKADSASRTAQ